jgi:hypothetical protein
MRETRIPWVLLVVVVLASIALAAASPGDTKLGRCLPAGSDISGWSIMDGTYNYGEGSGISNIYNGGYEKLVEKGMKSACVQSYRNESRRLTVYCNEFGSSQQAKAYYDEAEGSGWTTVSVTEGAKYKTVSSTVIGHLYRGKIHAKVVAKGTGAEQIEAVKSFLQKLSTRIGQNY